jgi:hypothetical protein
MAKEKIGKHHLNLAGEFRICSELLKRGISASVTYGNMKACDIVAIGLNRRPAIIEVKSSQSLKFVTGFYQKYKSLDQEHPTFWVFYSVRKVDREFVERFFVLTHEEVAHVQAVRNHHEHLHYSERARRVAKGVDNILAANIERDHENAWDKIVRWCSEPI